MAFDGSVSSVRRRHGRPGRGRGWRWIGWGAVVLAVGGTQRAARLAGTVRRPGGTATTSDDREHRGYRPHGGSVGVTDRIPRTETVGPESVGTGIRPIEGFARRVWRPTTAAAETGRSLMMALIETPEGRELLRLMDEVISQSHRVVSLADEVIQRTKEEDARQPDSGG